VGGIVGSLYDLNAIVQRFKPHKVYVVWEGGGSSRRRDIFPDYKAHRRPERLNRIYADEIKTTVSDHDNQIKMLVGLLKMLPINQLYVPDCEADDVIAYICRYEHPDDLHVILSSDKDYYQLVSDKTVIYSPTSKKIIQIQDVLERFSIHPNNFALAKSVCGDPSDNIPGISGVKFKTLSKRFSSLTDANPVMLDDFLNEARELAVNSKVKAPGEIIANESIIRRNWKLVHLDTGILSGTQIKKIQDQCTGCKTDRDKIGFIRQLLKLGIQTFNADLIFYTFSHIGA
jgi:5'-3' exonuclease